jgi:hypothetical protein
VGLSRGIVLISEIRMVPPETRSPRDWGQMSGRRLCKSGFRIGQQSVGKISELIPQSI